LSVKTVAALCRAVAFFVPFCLAQVPPHAAAADLQRATADTTPAFTLPDTAGDNVALEAARGRVVLVHFFATWCEPCREELPALNRLSARADGTVKVLAIAVADADRSVQRFLEHTPVNFPVLLDRDRAVAKAWQVVTLPTSFVLDANLQPRLVVESDYAWDTIDPDKLIDAPAAAITKASQSNSGDDHAFR
jgi:peroxiredoxin